MALSVWSLFFRNLLVTILFTTTRFVFSCAQAVIWRLNGTTRRLRDADKPQNYEQCAQVVDIWWRNRFDIGLNFSPSHYIYTHNRFVSPRYIFNSDDVTFISLTDSVAVFGETRVTGLRLWSTNCWSTMKDAQWEHCDKLIFVPRNVFHNMAEELGNLETKLVFMFSVGRCGSTLLTQMFEETGECVSISEPDVDQFISASFRNTGNMSRVRQDTRDAFRWVCRPYSYIKPRLYFIKVLPPCGVCAPLLKDVFPKSKFLFMYRDPINVAKSIHKMCMQLLTARLMYAVGRYSEKISELVVSGMGFSTEDFKCKQVDHYTVGIQVFCVLTKLYLNLLDEGKIDIAAVRYEDIMSDPSYAMRQVLNFVELAESTLSGALRGLDKDSQRNSMVSRKSLSGYVDVPITSKSRELANKLLLKSGLPQLGDNTPLRGTITCKAST